MVICGAVCTAALGGAVWWSLDQAQSPTCRELPEYTPDFAHVVAFSRRLRAYQQDASTNALLAMTATELSYFLGHGETVRMATHFEADQVHARVAVPRSDSCYNIDFVGDVTIDEGIATLVPVHMTVGDLDVSPVVRGMAFHITPEDLPDGRVAALLRNTRHLHVDGGRLVIDLNERTLPR